MCGNPKLSFCGTYVANDDIYYRSLNLVCEIMFCGIVYYDVISNNFIIVTKQTKTLK